MNRRYHYLFLQIPALQATYGLSNTSGSLDGSTMRCKFQRSKRISNDPKVFDLNELWFLFVANGPVIPGIEFLSINEKEQINLKKNKKPINLDKIILTDNCN